MSSREYEVEYLYTTIPLLELNAFLQQDCRQRYSHSGNKINVPWEIHTIHFEGGFAKLLLKRVS